MDKTEARKRIEELVGRIDVIKAEIRRAQATALQYASLNDAVPAREAEQDVERLASRLRNLEGNLIALKKFW